MARTRNAPRGPRQRRDGGGSTISAWLVGGLAILLISAILGGYTYLRLTKTAYDTATMCPIAGPAAVHAMLIDRSDPISPLQTQRLQQILRAIIDGAVVNERIDLYILSQDGLQSETPVVSLCRPPSEGNILVQNPEHIHAAYLARFVAPIEQSLTGLTQASELPNSPIMESIKAVCVAAFGGLRDGTPAYLTVVSDMIQNSPALNQYRPYDFATFARGPGMAQVTADCHRAQVDILYLLRPRDAARQTRAHELFWEQFFNRMNAVLQRVEPI